MKSLVIAEKPSVARDIARVLHCTQKGNGTLEGKDYVVTWALGHLVTLADPEEYDKKYMKWEISTLPMMPDRMKLVVIRQTGKQYNAVKTQLYRKDINDIIIATDAGREGELVARWILDKADCHKPIRRLWISSVTDKAIKEGFGNLKNGHEYDNLYRAAVARAEADWLVGMNGTRALTCKYNAQLSCGRVQTPTLAMIAKREEEIRAFKPKEYYGITLKAGDITWTWKEPKSKSFRTFNKERAEEISDVLRNQSLEVTSVTSKEKKSFAPGLYDLTTLQREANRKYGYSAKQTLNIMQRLYENHKVLTYPRTDSRYIGKDIVPTIKERLRACATGPYRKPAGALMNQPVRANGSFVDDKKVSDHHAIIPTEQFVQLDHMTNEERKIYDMVVRRFLSVLYPPFVYEQVSMEGTVAGELFAAGGKVVKSAGWKDVYENTDDTEEDEDTADDAQKLKDQKLPQMKKGERLHIENVSMNTGSTKPPARFTEATLLAAMENPVRYMESHDTKAAKTLGETGGLGTVATRADIIEKLFNSFLMEKKGNEITNTDLILSCGDLNPQYLSFLVSCTNLPLLYVHGNHDEKYDQTPPEGCICIDDKIYVHEGIRILGLGGCMPYKPGKYMYTEKEMKRRLLHIKHQLIFYRGFDILLTHAPAQGLGDGDDHAHQGYQTFLGLLDKYQPKYMVHGHMHLQYDHSLHRTIQYNNTQIINAYEKHSWEY